MARTDANPASGDRGARNGISGKTWPSDNSRTAEAAQDFTTFLNPLRSAAIEAGARIAIGGVPKQIAVDRLYALAVLVGHVRIFGDDAVQAVLAEGIKAGQRRGVVPAKEMPEEIRRSRGTSSRPAARPTRRNGASRSIRTSNARAG